MSDTPEKRGRGRPKSMDPEALLDIAIRAYWDTDPADVSINEICQRAGVSKPSVYRAFGNEDGLMQAALARYAATVFADLFKVLASDVSVDDLFAAVIAFAARDPLMRTGCVFFKTRAGKHRLGPLTRAKVDEIEGAAVAAFAGFLEARRTAGQWAGSQSPQLAARFIVEQIGLALMQRAAGTPEDSIEDMMRLALSALR